MPREKEGNDEPLGIDLRWLRKGSVNVASVPPGSIMLEVVADITFVSPGALRI